MLSLDFWYVTTIFIIGAIIGGLIAWLWSKSKHQQEREILKIKIAELEADIRNAQDIQNWVDNSKDNLREAFSALASQALQNNNDQFLQLANQQMDNTLNQVRGDWNTQKVEIEKIINPLDKNLDKLDEKIQNLEQKREGAYKGLEEQLRQLANTHQILQNSTTTLSQALKSSSVLGRWGEIQLRRIVELSGMLRHVDFQEQVSGNNLRPDMVVNMPNNGILPVDSKATLKFYLEAVSSDNEDARNAKLDLHAKSMQNHIRDLSQKQYWDQFSKSPDFVVMFVPSEAGLYAAFERNPSLLNDAIEKRVLIASPMTLLALLKAITYGWQQHEIADHIAQIVDESRELHKRLKTFTEHLGQLGKSINRLVENYNKSIGSFERRILPVSRRMQEMGLSATELIPPDSLETTATLPNTDDENLE